MVEGSEVRAEGSDTRTEGSSKRIGEDLQQESIQKQKVDEDKETAELQRLIEVFLDNRGRNQWETWDLVLYGDLKTMFDPHVKDQVWKNQSDYRVLDWKLYDSCGVHSLRKQNVHIHMLVEKRYPLTAPTITYMLNRKLQADHWNEMCYQLLKLITKPQESMKCLEACSWIVGIKRLLDDLEVTAAKVCVTAAKQKSTNTELRKLELAQKQKDEIQLTVEKLENSSKSLSKLIDCQIVDKCKIGLRYNVVPHPYTRNFMPPKLDLSFSGLEEFVNEPIVSESTVKNPVVETSEAKAIADKPKAVKKNNCALIIEDWVSDSEEEDMPQAKI
ncbi:hypothetical protein Tco_1206192 [Tanacetum coccineum]